jgi:exopolysaccharide biosynthesis polyprenyl glycosylphosphotransferase
LAQKAYALPLQLAQRRLERPIPPVATRVVADFLVAALALAAAYWVRFYALPLPVPNGELPSFGYYFQAAPVLSSCIVLVFALVGSYSQRSAIFVDELFGALKGLAVSALVVLAALTLNPVERFTYSRLTFIYWVVLASLMIGFARFIIRKAERRQRAHGIGTARCLVVGSGPAAEQLVQRIRMFPDAGYELRRTFGLDGDWLLGANGPTTDVSSAVAESIELEDIDVVFVALPHVHQSRIVEIIAANRRPEVEFRVVPTTLELIASQVEPDQLAGIPLLRIRRGLDVSPTQIRSKRVFDVAFSFVGLVLLAPLMAAIAIGIRISSRGPVLIRQERVGLHNGIFQMLKFRSMRVDAEKDSGPVWTDVRDSRRTAVGRFLRRFSLDELPQLWNVLTGDMSLAGPRPERPVFVTDFASRIPAYGDRHRVRPGLTGWAQVNDLRGMTSVEDRLVYDLYYVERWSLAFDIKIILTTAFRVFSSKNAY